MRAGFGKRDITPWKGVDLAGFGRLDRENRGVHDPVFATALAIEEKGKKVLIVACDIIGFGYEGDRKIKETLGDMFGYEEDEILLNASHTHSGPQTLENMLPTLGSYNEEYMDEFYKLIYETCRLATDDMEEVDFFYGETDCNIGVNRRLIIDGKAQFKPNDDGPSDKTVNVIKMESPKGIKCVLFSYACHPSTIGADYVSADYPGVARNVIEKAMGIKDRTMFIQGCCGNIRVRTIGDGNFRPGKWADIENFGTLMGNQVTKVLKSEMKLYSPQVPFIKTDLVKLNLPFDEPLGKEQLEEHLSSDNVHLRLWAERMLEDGGSRKDLSFTIQRIGFANEIDLVALGGEVVIEYGLFAKEAAGDKKVICAGYSNALAGYITTDEMFDQGGYEPAGSTIYYYFPATLKKGIQKPIEDTISTMLEY